MPKHKISPQIRERIRNVEERLDRLDEQREQKSPEDYEWFKRFFLYWRAELEEWLRRAEWHESDHERFDERAAVGWVYGGLVPVHGGITARQSQRLKLFSRKL